MCVCAEITKFAPLLEKWPKNLILKICARLKSVGILKARIIARSISGALIYIKYLRYTRAASPGSRVTSKSETRLLVNFRISQRHKKISVLSVSTKILRFIKHDF